ncbi:alpha/beta hydrolase [Falsiroseomonas oryziterrae]|uniref:alpha/beta hydrolase n=1 Tax=Falsiroseomonas oryziterrae TaxID=2911368 RepID=UPI001F40EB01|nr:alpha/beta hydrolase [Roseomonas sp. NPKOSM-4]
MSLRVVHFATNRIWDRTENRFGFVPEVPATRLWLGRVKVGVSADPFVDGKCSAPDVAGFDDFAGGADETGSAAGVLAAWLAVAKARDAVPLLSVHGFDFDFEEACARTGNLCDWLEAEGGARFEPLAFTWPSNGITSLSAYKDDQADCAASGPALARLMQKVAEAAKDSGAKPPAYIAHSMGARCTRFAMQAVAKQKKAVPAAFGEAVVIGGDDDVEVLDAPEAPLARMTGFARHLTIGIYSQDATLSVISARVQNKRPRLGAEGPATQPKAQDRIFVVDYSYVVSEKPEPAGASTWNYTSHQYHRNDVRVRRDLVAALSGTPPEQVPGRRWGKPDAAFAIQEVPGRLYVLPDSADS